MTGCASDEASDRRAHDRVCLIGRVGDARQEGDTCDRYANNTMRLSDRTH